jgi:hypothetical protein
MDESRFLEYLSIIKHALNKVKYYEQVSVKHGVHPYYIYLTSDTCKNCLVDTENESKLSILLMHKPILKYTNFIQYKTVCRIDLALPGSITKLGTNLVKVLSLTEEY